ncbi:MAG: hypothetical protein QXU95_02080 [Candidatus Bathyarchaeia archaeon]
MLNFEEVKNLNNILIVPEPCRFCLYWQTSGELQHYASEYGIKKREDKMA